MSIETYAVGKCLFGDKVHKILLVDGNRNLRVDDAGKPVARGNGITEAGIADSVFIDVKCTGWERPLPNGRCPRSSKASLPPRLTSGQDDSVR